MADDINSSDRAWSLLIDTYATLMPRFEAEMRSEVGISPSWFDVTANLVTAPEHQMRMSDLAERTVISFSRVSRVVDELAARGLVERITDPEDRRGVIVKLTAAGTKLQRDAGRVHLRGIREHFSAHLSEPQADELVAALESVLRAHQRPPSPLKAWKQPD
jgi:DNA-binding MarR family transcriptional regulator